MSKRYQNLSKNDQSAPVDVFPLLMLDHLGIERLDRGERAAIAEILARQRPPDLGQLVGGRSFNAPQVVAAAMLLCGSPTQRKRAGELMITLNRYQLGMEEPPAERAILRYHGGPEHLGEYWPWRWYCDAVALLVGLQRGDSGLVEMGHRALAAHAALAALISVPEEPMAEKGGWWSNAKGRQILTGPPFPLLAAERLNMGHVNGQELSMLFCETTRRPFTFDRPEQFVSVLLCRFVVAAAVKAGLSFPSFQPGGLGADGSIAPDIEAALRGVRLRGRTRILRWPDFALAYLGEAQNHNTVGMLAVGFDRRARRPLPVFPFQDDTKKWKGRAMAAIEGSRLVASGPGGKAVLDLPAGPPLVEVVLDDTGVNLARPPR